MKILIIVIILLAIVCFVVYRRRAVSFPVKVKFAYGKGNVNVESQDLSRELSFVSDVVSYFKVLKLNPKTDTPFLIDGAKLRQWTADALPQTTGVSLLLGVYHETTDDITDCRLLNATSFDTKTKEVLAKSEDGIIALS